MHNCKATREQINELLLSGVETCPDALRTREECRTEFETLRETLRLTTRVIESAVPATNAWADYKLKLKQKLADVKPATEILKQQTTATSLGWWRRCLMASVRVPAPVAVAVVLLFAATLIFAFRRSDKTAPAAAVTIVHVPVEVPVVQEKVVTRIVYRQSTRPSVSRTGNPEPNQSAIAKSQLSPVSLSEFKPLDEVKFKIIKGGSPDEK